MFAGNQIFGKPEPNQLNKSRNNGLGKRQVKSRRKRKGKLYLFSVAFSSISKKNDLNKGCPLFFFK